jgi:acetaldehyde dehydrogenase (acetylating)
MDKDLESIQEVRKLCERSLTAQAILAEFSQEKIDSIVASMKDICMENAEVLAQEAINETKLGILKDKVTKNRFAADNVFESIKGMKTVGIIKEYPEKKVYEIAEPMGPIAGIVPMTNPTSTVIFKSLIAVKARNTIVFAPHPRAVQCSMKTVDLINNAAIKAGAPDNCVQCISTVTMEGTNELMKNRNIGLILATGGSAMVKAAYSSGKPAIGVGPGNVPVFLDRSCNIEDAISKIVLSKSFDNGTVCSSEQAIICDEKIDQEVEGELKRNGCYFMNEQESRNVGKVLFTYQRLPDPELVGKPARSIAERAGISIPEGTKILIAKLDEVGEEYPLSGEKISPVLAYYVSDGWQNGCKRCIEILKYGGIGHTLIIHAKDEDIIREFAMKKPAFRILVNAPGTHGAIGFSTGLSPSLTLGCGTWGGGITSDNISPLHLINIKRLAYNLLEDMGIQKVSGEESEPGQEKDTSTDELSDERIEKIIEEFLDFRRRKGSSF